MATNNSFNVNSVTPLSPTLGGTGVNNTTNTLTVTANSSVNQDVTTSGSPVFTAVTPGNLNLSTNVLISTGVNQNIAIVPNGTGCVAINSSTLVTPLLGKEAQILKLGNQGALRLASYSNGATGNSFSILFTKSRGAAIGSDVALINGDNLSNIQNLGYDGATYRLCGNIAYAVDGVVSTGILPSRMTISTGNLSGTTTVGLTIDSSQNVTLNHAGATLTTPNFASTPAASAASTLALGTAYQNTLGYDVILIVYVAITSATAASLLSGVGPTVTPTQQTIVSGLTLAALGVVPITVYLPNNYYALISTGGTITASISGQQVTPV